MIGVVVAAHGSLADALLVTARGVVPDGGPVEAVGLAERADLGEYETRLRDAVQRARRDGGVLVLTDTFGGTPSNVSLALHRSGEVEILTGVNLPMVIKALQLSGKQIDLASAARTVREYGMRAITVASDVLAQPAPPAQETPT